MDKTLTVLLSAIREAGDAALSIRQHGLKINLKANKDFVTQADCKANDILKSALLAAFPHDGWLSEETVDDIKRLERKRVWIVDPIDGTKEFVQGLSEFAVSVALIERGRPILAAIYNPAKDELFHAALGAQ